MGENGYMDRYGWVPLLFSRNYRNVVKIGSVCVFVCVSCSVVSDSATPWAVARQASVHGILQARILEWMCVSHSVIPNPLRPRTATIQAPLSMGFSRQEHWSGLLFPSTAGVGSHSLLQGIFPTQRLNPGLLHSRQILYHLSQQGSPDWLYKIKSLQMVSP